MTAFPAFARSLLAAAIARAFTPPPDIPIWRWADGDAPPPHDKGVWLQSEDAAEPGPYRSAKTPWTRRLQELGRHPIMWVVDYTDPKKPRWIRSRVTEANAKKSTQSGFTEAILNVIRWFITFRPRNVMYRIDAVDRARKIARRLLRSLKLLDPEIFTDDPDDIKTTEFILRGMELWFIGSFNPGQATQVQAGIVVNDEVEEHAESIGETSTLRDSKYRKKTHTDGLEFNIGKPKLEGGPIHEAWAQGNKEEFHLECPKCHHLQWIGREQEKRETPFAPDLIALDRATGEVLPKSAISNLKSAITWLPRPLPRGETRLISPAVLQYRHCRDLLGEWDKLKIQREVFAECSKCKHKIFELKYDERGHVIGVGVPQSLVAQAATRDDEMLGWLPTAVGTPGIVSQHMNDLLSSDQGSYWGDIILELVDAMKRGPKEIQGVVNNRFGNEFAEQLSKTQEADIRANVAGKTLWFVDSQTEQGSRRDVFENEAQAKLVAASVTDIQGGKVVPIASFCKPYKRGNIPFVPSTLLLGSDVGGNYARWVIAAVLPNKIDAAVIDWGDELDPDAIADIVLNETWPCSADGKRRRIAQGFIDSHAFTTEILRACWHVFTTRRSHILIPTAMIGGTAARGMKTWSYHPVRSYRGRVFNHKSFKQLGYNFREAMNDVAVTCIQRKQRRIWFPVELGKQDKDLTPDERQFITELCNDELVEDKNGRKNWADPPPGPNHYMAALKNCITGLRFLTRMHHLQRDGTSETRPGEIPESEDASS